MSNTDLAMKKTVESISTGIEMVDREINRTYLADLETHRVKALAVPEKTSEPLGFVKITRIVSNREENFNEKLASVYSSLYTFFTSSETNVDGAIIMLICGKPDRVDYYLGIRHNSHSAKLKTMKDTALKILCNSLEGQFPGSDIGKSPLTDKESATLLNKHIPVDDAHKKVSSVYAVPSLKMDKEENYVQGIENFIDTMAGKEYTALFVSTPIAKTEMERRKRGLENMYTELSKLSEINLSFGINKSESEADGTSLSFTETLGDSVSDAKGHSFSSSFSESFGTSSQGLFGQGSSHSKNHGYSDSTSTTHTTSKSTSEAKGISASKTITNTLGINASKSITVQVKPIQEYMIKIELQLERIKKGDAYGLWESASYFIADEPEISIIAANTYRSLLVGEKTSADRSVINYWGDKPQETESLMAYLHNSIHPVFIEKAETREYVKGFEEKYLSASNMVNGQELPILMGLPQKSVSGVTSISFASFGRNVQTGDKINEERNKRKINLGCIYHMGKELKETKVVLTANEFTKHCFVTGSTGSGKSNTVYKLLEEFIHQKETDHSKDGAGYDKVTFLVIEPAKGEYKKAFAKLRGINIFTTNAKIHKLLKLNPFTFPDEGDNGIHVLEHLDRLIEIFSACWPLYAAMPAVLKESFEKAYERVGWDLQNSIYTGEGEKKYPGFKTVSEILPEILEHSKFSAENKGNYEGALVTRVNSLTMGIMGTIFTAESEIPNEVLFDQNTIVDISRVGSSETKSLIMGILILKLNEYRMSEDKGTNLPLRHITVLEEAHNILKRTSTDQSQEGANLSGKSVEMISNSIAEMRSYGEGFIIVDQSPAMVAQSAISNTNTKIIMRLADYSDCETVGRSVSLNDAQILEISRLNQGVAVIHQSSWTEAVLAKIDRNTAEDKYENNKVSVNDFLPLKKMRSNLLTAIFKQRKDDFIDREELERVIRNTPRISPETEETYIKLIYDIEKISGSEDMFSEMIVNILECRGMIGACVPEFSKPFKANGNPIGGIHDIEIKANWFPQIKKALKNYVDAKEDVLDELVYCIVNWIDLQNRQNSKGFNKNLLQAGECAARFVLKTKAYQ